MFKKIRLMFKLKKIYNKINAEVKEVKKNGLKGEIIMNLFDYVISYAGMFDKDKDILSSAGNPAANSVKVVNFMHGFTSRLKAAIVDDKILTYAELKKALEDQLKQATLY